MASTIAKQIVRLAKLSRQDLVGAWQQAYGKDAPSGIRREVMIPFLAYRIQENAEGALKPTVRAELKRIARKLESKGGRPRRVSRTRVKAGTRFIRHWRGETHEVSVTDRGYEYRGSSYRSLSEVARLVTGTRWSGPAFFGLNKLATVRDEQHA